MANSKKRKALTISVLIVALLSAFVTFLAQTKSAEVSVKQASAVFPEQDKETSSRNKLARLLSRVGVELGPSLPTSNAPTYRESRIHWESFAQPQTSGLLKDKQLGAGGTLTSISSIDRTGVLPRERSLELSSDQMLVVALDKNDAVRWWRVMIDPRLVRAEVGQTSEMHSENFYVAKVEFLIESPADPLLTELRFYRPVWDGAEFHLEPIGSAPLH